MAERNDDGEATNSTAARGASVVPELPVHFRGPVVRGFGRGSKDLGCPTANIPIEEYAEVLGAIPMGVYCAFAQVEGDPTVHMSAMSIGWNPFYKNDKKTIEAHILHEYDGDFYGKELRLIVVRYVRPETSFPSLDALTKAIADDIEFTRQELSQEKYKTFYQDEWFSQAS